MAKVLKEVYALSGNPMIEESVDALEISRLVSNL